MRSPSARKKFIFAFLSLLLAFSFLALLYFASIVWRGASLRNSERRWSDNIFRFHPDLGYSTISGKTVFHTIPGKDKVPVVFDENGIRSTPNRNNQASSKILFLGCSFTHGYGVESEKTFSALTGEGLEMNALNAGKPGWGLAQMQLETAKLVPLVKPQIVVLQYSKWLPERSMQIYAPFNFGKCTVPYYSKAKDASIQISPPAFHSVAYDLDIPAHADDSLPAFTFNVSLPLFLHDDFMSLLTNVKLLLGLIPAPCGDKDKITSYAYSEIAKICAENNAKPYILHLYGSPRDKEEKNPAFPSDIPVIDSFDALGSKLQPTDEKSWKKAYSFVDDKSGKILDSHPNHAEHKIISEKIINTLR